MTFHITSKKPILIVGNGVRGAGAQKTLSYFYEKTGIPVLTTMNAVDLMQDGKRLGFIGVYGNRIANMIVAQCDLVISIGARLGLRQIGNKKEFFAPNAKLIRADIDQYELSRSIKEDEEKYLMDANEFLQRLMNEDIPKYVEWNEKCFKAKKLLDPYDKNLGNYCIEKISSLLPVNPIVAIDVGQNQCWSAQSLCLRGNDGRILIGGSYGSMGCSLPYAIGASCATGKNTVFCITGDGGMQMNIQELQTVFSEKLPVKIFVLNNRVLGKISEIQSDAYQGRYMITTHDSGYTVPDFTKIATAYGIKAKTLSSLEELDLCTNWLSDKEPCLINIILPEDTLLQPKMSWNQKEMLPLLDESIMCEVRNILA